MRVRVTELLESLPISLTHFIKLARECEVENYLYLTIDDLRKLHSKMRVKTYKSEMLFLRIKDLLDDFDGKKVV